MKHDPRGSIMQRTQRGVDAKDGARGDSTAEPICEWGELRLCLFDGQDLVRNAEPFGRLGAVRKEGNPNRRTVGQQLVQLDVMSRRRARDIECGLNRRVWRVGQTPVQSNVKDKPEVQIN